MQTVYQALFSAHTKESGEEGNDLFVLSKESNGTQYCEPHTGVHCSTDLTAGIRGGNEMCCFGAGEEITT